MTDEARPGESRRDIAGNSLRALRAARGGTAPDSDATEVHDDPAELTDDPAVQPDGDLPAGSREEVYADEVLDAETEADTGAETGEAGAAGHDDTDDPSIDDPAELTDDPAEEPESPVGARAVDRVADDEPPNLAAATLRARRSKVGIAKTDAAGSDESAPTESSAIAERRAAAPARTRRRPAPLVIALAAVTAAALVFAVVSAVVWYRADNDGAREIATARDEVATEARLAVATVNTVDYTKADASLDNWLTVSTGKFRSEVSDSKRSAAKVLAQAKVSTTAVVLDAAVTSLDTAKGTATVIAAVNIKKTPLGKASATDPRRVRASMKLVNGEWKLADLGEVAGAVFQ